MRRVCAILALTVLAACGTTERTDPQPAPGDRRVHESRVKSFDGLSVAYSVAGGGGGTLLFVHGWCCDRHFWDAQLEEFADEYTVVAVDLGGHGDSGLARADWNVQTLARDVEAVVDELGLGSVVLVGHSMGGPVALEAARRMPDRVVGVIGVDTFQDAEPNVPDDWDEQMAAFERDFAGNCREFVAGSLIEGTDPALAERIRAAMCDDAAVGPAVTLLRAYPDYDLARALAAATVPVRTINGSRWPTRVEINRKYDPDFDAVFLEGTGHFPMLERPEEFDRLLRRIVEEITAGATD